MLDMDAGRECCLRFDREMIAERPIQKNDGYIIFAGVAHRATRDGLWVGHSPGLDDAYRSSATTPKAKMDPLGEDESGYMSL